ncbi:CCA tRNA nucleotidyltransferase [Halalkalibacillus halophilus]|uniref:CCA tRNA nucleotidyltransferase n=1 Tax=Halalkalibacillus halophilus TaxID=392827 RepID=UPI000418F4C7|nr:CCA tRNA nucleotidyltransferase [Halalkalibacillus halophilus]
MLQAPFKHASYIITELNKQGYEAYFVGGAVRDYLLNLPIGDIDLATNASPEEVMRIFSKTIPTGIKHGTILVIHEGKEYEVTTYRSESSYVDYRRPGKVDFVNNLVEDLSRRDFTINAIAMSLDGELIDPFQGQLDLKAKLIRTVGNPNERFQEDGLRILRAVRFVSQLHFSVEPLLQKAILDNRAILKHIAMERIQQELLKMFRGQAVNIAIQLIKDTSLFTVLPIFKSDERIIHNLASNLHQSLSTEAVIVAYLHLLNENYSVNDWVKTYRLSNQTRRDAAHLVTSYNRYIKHGLSLYNVYLLEFRFIHSFVELLHAKGIKLSNDEVLQIYHQLPIKSRSDLKINGSDIVQLFPQVKKGSWIQNYLLKLESLVIAREINNTEEELKEMVSKWKTKENNS